MVNGTVIEVSGALPLREGETEVGSEQISVDLIREFLVEDLRLGLETSLKETPRDMLRDTIEKGEWWKGIVLSGAFLEHFGSGALKRVTRNKINNEKINLRLFQILRLLFDFGVFDSSMYGKVDEVRKERNKCAHDPFATIDPTTAKKLIEDTIECLDFLGVADNPIS